MSGVRHAWIDASAGIAGDMLLAAFVDAGARLDVAQEAVDAVVPGAVRIVDAMTSRAGLRALALDIALLVDGPPRRTWQDIRKMLFSAELPGRTSEMALEVFDRLARAEARVHGCAIDDVHFHEVGALDSIADVVATCAAFDDLGIISASASEVSVGSGSVLTVHGELPVPVPAVLELAQGWRIKAGSRGELATPTGMALLRTLAGTCEELPSMLVERVGVGAGRRDPHDWANVVRLVIGSTTEDSPLVVPIEQTVLLETNVDDLDPRLWPNTMTGLLESGASDAWLVPIVMKKGRPAYTLCVLCEPTRVEALRARIFRDTSTLGIRESRLQKVALFRCFAHVALPSGTVAVKVGHAGGVILQVMPEFEDVAAIARRLGRPERLVLQDAVQAATGLGLTVGSILPPYMFDAPT